MTILGITALACLILFAFIGLILPRWNSAVLEKHFFNGRLFGDEFSFPWKGRTFLITGFEPGEGKAAYTLRGSINVPFHFRIESTTSSRFNFNRPLWGRGERQKIGSIEYFVMTNDPSALGRMFQRPAVQEWMQKYLDRSLTCIAVEKCGSSNALTYRWIPPHLLERYEKWNFSHLPEKPSSELTGYIDGFQRLLTELESRV